MEVGDIEMLDELDDLAGGDIYGPPLLYEPDFERDAEDPQNGVDSTPKPKPKPKPEIKPKPAPKPKPAEKPLEPTDKPGKKIKAPYVKFVDFRVPENTKAHHTDFYEDTYPNPENPKERPKLIIRRGQCFSLALTFDRPYKKAEDDVILVFVTGGRPRVSNGTKAEVSVDESGAELGDSIDWSAGMVSSADNGVVVTVCPATDCAIGEWQLFVETKTKTSKDAEERTDRYQHNEYITILYNPWCKDDTVYLEDDELRKEYVCNQVGCIYRGSVSSQDPNNTISAKPWVFGQFRRGILEICLKLVRTNMPTYQRFKLGSPVLVSRLLSKMVNCNDDEGVLYGRWDGDYKLGKSPGSWSGSVAILEQWAKDMRPVKYGQCWVFSAVTTTVCRAVGIPARCITNFSSAHDVDGNITIDNYTSVFGDKIDSPDSVWNYHCWNEVWMTRPDLLDMCPPGCPCEYDGWQVIDATPQEASDGVFQCGPASVKAIKEGRPSVPYDVAFVIAEVNADRLHYMTTPTGNILFLLSSDTTSVGRCISSKIPSEERVSYFNAKRLRDDVTNHYKYPEGLSEERESIVRACLGLKKKRTPRAAEQKLKATLTIDCPPVMIGSDLKMTVTVRSQEERPLKLNKLTLTCTAVTYTGEEVRKLKPYDDSMRAVSVTVPPKGEFSMSAVLTEEDYIGSVYEFGMIKLEARATIFDETNPDIPMILFKREVECLERPELLVELPKEAKTETTVIAALKLTNPLSRPLTGCCLSVASDCIKDIEDMELDSIGPGETYTGEIALETRSVYRGNYTLVVTLDTFECPDATGSAQMYMRY